MAFSQALQRDSQRKIQDPRSKIQDPDPDPIAERKRRKKKKKKWKNFLFRQSFRASFFFFFFLNKISNILRISPILSTNCPIKIEFSCKYQTN